MRNNYSWIESAIYVIMIVCAIGALAVVFVAVHFIIKYW